MTWNIEECVSSQDRRTGTEESQAGGCPERRGEYERRGSRSQVAITAVGTGRETRGREDTQPGYERSENASG